MILGAHIGIAGGLDKVPALARSIGCDTLQIFSKNQQQWKAAPLDPKAVAGFKEGLKAEKLTPGGVHASYLINLGSPKPELQAQSQDALVDEIRRVHTLGLPSLILHPGAHVGSGEAAGIAAIAKGVQKAVDTTAETKVRVLLETAAGQGSTLGRTFDELQQILVAIDRPDRTGVCLDTCHVFAAGWDLRTEAGYARMMESIEATIGVPTVRFFHLNDAKSDLGSHVDRHENIGDGKIGLVGFRRLVNDKRFAQVCATLETPVGEDKAHPYAAYEKDLKTLRRLLVRS